MSSRAIERRLIAIKAKIEARRPTPEALCRRLENEVLRRLMKGRISADEGRRLCHLTGRPLEELYYFAFEVLLERAEERDPYVAELSERLHHEWYLADGFENRSVPSHLQPLMDELRAILARPDFSTAPSGRKRAQGSAAATREPAKPETGGGTIIRKERRVKTAEPADEE